MKIILTCDPEIPVPPLLYGGIERIVDGLAKGYSELGHEVYLVAHPDSNCQFTIKNFAWPAKKSNGFISIFKNSTYLQKVVREIKPDIIHSFSRLLYLYPSFYFRKIRFIQTYQREISQRSTQIAGLIAGSKLSFTSCGAHMIKDLPNKKKFTPIFNFTDTDYFDFDVERKREYLLFLGRIEDIKGTAEAIEVAISSNEKLIIAGNIPIGHENYFTQKIEPFLSNELIEYVGAVNDEQKKNLLQGAKAMLFPIKWEEPFGIVMAEALACGTPVIGFNRGSVPEVVKHGKNGFIANNTIELIEFVGELDKLDYSKISKNCKLFFSVEKISMEYLSI